MNFKAIGGPKDGEEIKLTESMERLIVDNTPVQHWFYEWVGRVYCIYKYRCKSKESGFEYYETKSINYENNR